MFEYSIVDRKHYTGKAGIETYTQWCVGMGIDTEDFPFRLKTGRKTRKGHDINLNVVSWGFYQGSDWRYYVFITYRTSDQSMTCAYHWDVDNEGFPCGTPRKHSWAN